MEFSFAILLALLIGGIFLVFDAICHLVGKQKYSQWFRLAVGLTFAVFAICSLFRLG